MANMKLIEAKTLNSAVSSVVFSAIPQTYTDLKLVCSVRSNDTGVDSVRIRPNGSTSNMYTRWIQGDITGTAGSVTSENYPFALVRCNGNNVTSTFGSGEFYITNYASTTLNKALWTFSTSESGGERMLQNICAALWSDTTAISSITLVTESGQNFLTNSTFYLYGIESSAITGTKATGGVIYQDTNYFYHVFGTSGTFTPTQSLSCDLLVIGGGGSGGGYIYGGGGGAGGLVYSPAYSLSATGYAVTIGAGGAGNTGNGSNGSDTTFSSIYTATGGGAGGSWNANKNGQNGGSGGGGGENSGAGTAGTATQASYGGLGFGNNGGVWSGGSAGGGGGSGGVGGVNGVGYANSAGGIGKQYTDFANATGTGQGTYYAAGGGGCSNGGMPIGEGGLGGGGNGSAMLNSAVYATAGAPNTGSGGGGDNTQVSTGGNGGSGLVIVRYAK